MTRLRERLVEFKEQVSESAIAPRRRRVSPASYLFCYRRSSFRVKSLERVQSCRLDSQGLEESCPWSQLPETLLSFIFSKVETDRTDWDSVKTLYAASGVCKSWRNVALPLVLQDLWQTPGLLQIIHPAQLFSLNPSEDSNLIKCSIIREEISGSLGSSFVRFNLYLESEGTETDQKFLLSAMQHTW